ncbi:MAG: hypothetical protein GY950_25455 [bacterium]|nr:hypothetical protein [bacterium]
MKLKKFNKKLLLNKKTIADLNGGEMKNALGGVPPDLSDHVGPKSGCIICPTFPHNTRCQLSYVLEC